MDFMDWQANEDNTPSLKAAGTPLVPIENLHRPPVPASSSSPSESNFRPEHSPRNCLSMTCFYHHSRRKSLSQDQCGGHPSGQTCPEPFVSENALTLTAHLLLSLTSVEHNGKPITIKPYAPSPPISCLGFIHNVGDHFTSSQLLHDLESFTSDILAARMMGSTESVLITFAGTIIPRFVYFKRVSFRCLPHKTKPPPCTRCLAIGHRAHQCPNTAFRPSATAVRLLY
ncbi:hypothetical protein HPB51_009659 [Rhipicephalus microplus]|uniref:CCHC-type domain-containing protein n=1 Tax=Rhipicephalus microplus TaxID=6941 RepID=A0A9J6EN56_RHIMP|nr:hypothetical protein HPB51_009659 [Rhipicephalus microplus]